MKLNTPGNKGGMFAFWINEEFQGSTHELEVTGQLERCKNMKINRVLFENYRNSGSVQDQQRCMDNIVVKCIDCSFSGDFAEITRWLQA